MVTPESIKENYSRVCEDIQQAAAHCGRAGADVQLVVVTKAQPVEIVRAVVQAGALILGENYPEESVEKIEALRDCEQIQWHMIGHLQSRKAKIIVQHFDMLHSLDSLSLAEKLNRLLQETGRRLPVLLEFNVGGEASKTGWDASDQNSWPAFIPVIEKLLTFEQLEIRGLMTMPPWFENAEATRPYFVRLRQLRDTFSRQFPGLSWDQLSMGTSTDFRVAIEEGSTMVRIGTAIVGPRPPKRTES